MRQALEEYLSHAYRYALCMVRRHHLAEDIAQEAMLRAWQNRRRFKDIREGRVWILKIVANLCRDHWRRQQHVVSRADSLGELEIVAESSPSQNLEDRELPRVDAGLPGQPLRSGIDRPALWNWCV